MRYLWCALSAGARLFTVGAWLLLIALVLVVHAPANAQTTCTAGGQTTCFVASKTTGESPISTTLTWNVVGASACTAGPTTGWTGTVPTSGTRNLTGIGVKMTLTLDCTAPATGGKMRLTWTPPTNNTDGSTLTDLGGYRIEYGTASGSLTQSVNLAVPAANTYDVPDLTAGTWFARLIARNAACFPSSTVNCHESVPSATVSKAVTTTPGGNLPQLTILLDPYKVPNPPTNVVATDVTAFAITPNDDGTLLATRIALVPLSTSCVDDRCTVLTRRAQ